MDTSKFGWENVIRGQGIELTVTGMLVVFLGLLLIATFVNYLPVVFALLGRVNARQRHSDLEPVSSPEHDEDEIAAVLGYVIEMEINHSLLTGPKKITIDEEGRDSAWGYAGKMRTLSARR